ncbi:hypothetical protein EV182_000451 [Spiromyces aspiralis]|uniref:Uncharacterized protein n=1 Tax=Spiromyces aspiralis TaxID=68401 RepID=A0ACC1HY90_9FUNG|nr:hypothetical protein EV182_000451 [Spiromyces aspiralis]
MRFGLHRVDQTLLPGHKLERRLATWEELQQQQFIDIHRRNLGLYVPFRKMMERTIILGENARIPAGLCGNQVARFHMDILEGRDETLDIKDVFVDPSDESYKDLPGPIH